MGVGVGIGEEEKSSLKAAAPVDGSQPSNKTDVKLYVAIAIPNVGTTYAGNIKGGRFMWSSRTVYSSASTLQDVLVMLPASNDTFKNGGRHKKCYTHGVSAKRRYANITKIRAFHTAPAASNPAHCSHEDSPPPFITCITPSSALERQLKSKCTGNRAGKELK